MIKNINIHNNNYVKKNEFVIKCIMSSFLMFNKLSFSKFISKNVSNLS